MQLGELADRSIGAGVMRPFIAIIPAAGATPAYGGEWAGPWETALVERVVQWVDAHLPTIAAPPGRLIAGLSAGGYGAVDIALRHLGLFGTVEAWSGYFAPLPDGPFAKADRSTLEANDPTMLARTEAAVLRRDRIRFFLSTGPHHSRRIDPAATARFARELRRHGVTVVLRSYLSTHDEWRSQFDAGLLWGLGRS
jgi:enterochelin esterase-like enzyme